MGLDSPLSEPDTVNERMEILEGPVSGTVENQSVKVRWVLR